MPNCKFPGLTKNLDWIAHHVRLDERMCLIKRVLVEGLLLPEGKPDLRLADGFQERQRHSRDVVYGRTQRPDREAAAAASAAVQLPSHMLAHRRSTRRCANILQCHGAGSERPSQHLAFLASG